MNIYAMGGDSQSFPSCSREAIVASYVAGASGVVVPVRATSDDVLVLFEHDQLRVQSDFDATVEQTAWSDLEGIDIGYHFQVGEDYPWRKVRSPFERDPNRPRLRARLYRLDELVNEFGDSSFKLFLVPKGPNQGSRAAIAQDIGSLVQKFQIGAVIVGEDPEELDKWQNSLDADSLLKFGLISNSLGDANVNYAFVDHRLEHQREHVEYVARCEPFEGAKACLVRKVVETVDRVLGRNVFFEDGFRGKQLNRRDWAWGISGGFETASRFFYNSETDSRLAEDHRDFFDTRLRQEDGLVIDVREGYQYASAAVVTKFGIRGDFFVEVGWSYSNPERATMALLGITNTSVFQSHQPSADRVSDDGTVTEPRWRDEHQIYDTHGCPPFVSVEHEENDGTRIICNRVGTGFYRWFNNFYHPNVGNGLGKKGKFRLARRGDYFSAYYQDEVNNDWVGVGALENCSLNQRVYIRMGGKHYPKTGAPSPLPKNFIKFSEFKVLRRDKTS